jgi:hypothetical protein
VRSRSQSQNHFYTLNITTVPVTTMRGKKRKFEIIEEEEKKKSNNSRAENA